MDTEEKTFKVDCECGEVIIASHYQGDFEHIAE
jgi:hypothetical protein